LAAETDPPLRARVLLQPAAMRRWLGACVIAGLALACGCTGEGGTEDDADTADDAAALSAGWTVLGNGVAHKSIGGGAGVFIGYAGYSVPLDRSAAWVDALSEARLKALDVGHVYAVRGPSDPGYANKNIANTRLAKHLVDEAGTAAPFVLVGAHSSGSYVAHELFGQLFDGAGDPGGVLDGKIVYANLDGGAAGLDAHVLSSLKKIAFVWAEDTTLAAGRSANAGGMEALGRQHGGSGVRLVVDRSGCHSGAKWCLHDLLITSRPHDPDRFDLVRDYTDFAGRPVQTGWIRALEGALR
jgi:hypothetical protein